MAAHPIKEGMRPR
jgi:hypothetical protein